MFSSACFLVLLVVTGCAAPQVGSPQKSGKETTASGESKTSKCDYWATVSFGQDDSQLIKINSDGEGEVFELDSYGEKGTESTINGATNVSVSEDGGQVLVAAADIFAGGPNVAKWEVLDANGERTQELNWNNVEEAIVSPDGKHAAYVADNYGPYGIRPLTDPDPLWTNPNEGAMRMGPVRWLSNETVYFYDSNYELDSDFNVVAIPTGYVIDLEGNVLSEHPMPPVIDEDKDSHVLFLLPSADLTYFIGLSDDDTLTLFDKDAKPLSELSTSDAELDKFLWIDNDTFAYLDTSGDLMWQDVTDEEPTVAVEDFAGNVLGADRSYTGPGGNFLNYGSIVAACG